MFIVKDVIKKNKLTETTRDFHHFSSSSEGSLWQNKEQWMTLSHFPQPPTFIEASVHIGPGMNGNLLNPDKTKINYLSSSRINISNKANLRKAKQLLIAKSLNLRPVSISNFTSM